MCYVYVTSTILAELISPFERIAAGCFSCCVDILSCFSLSRSEAMAANVKRKFLSIFSQKEQLFSRRHTYFECVFQALILNLFQVSYLAFNSSHLLPLRYDEQMKNTCRKPFFCIGKHHRNIKKFQNIEKLCHGGVFSLWSVSTLRFMPTEHVC